MKTIKAKRYGYKILVPVKFDGIGRAVYVYNQRELDHKWILENTLSLNDKILDIGANVGYYLSLEAFLLKNNCTLYAVEPDPRNIKYLSMNVDYLGLGEITSIQNVAISNFTGFTNLIKDKKSNLSKLATKETDECAELINVKVVSFAEYLENVNEQFQIVRMDIEGAEINVLENLLTMVNSNFNLLPKRIIYETHDYGHEKHRMSTILKDILNRGYTVEYLTSDDELFVNPKIKEYGYLGVSIKIWLNVVFKVIL